MQLDISESDDVCLGPDLRLAWVWELPPARGLGDSLSVLTSATTADILIQRPWLHLLSFINYHKIAEILLLSVVSVYVYNRPDVACSMVQPEVETADAAS